MTTVWIYRTAALILMPGVVVMLFFACSRNLRTMLNLLWPLSVGAHYLMSQILQLWRRDIYSNLAVFQIAALLVVILVFGLKGQAKRFESHENLNQIDLPILLGTLIAGIYIGWQYLKLSGGWDALIPNNDGQNHAFFVKNLMSTGRLSAGVAQRYFPNVADSAGRFYPLGIHNVIARAVTGSGSSIPQVTNCVLVIAVIVYCVNSGLLVRQLGAKRWLTALCLPTTLVLVSPGYPWRPLAWGGLR